MISTNSEGIDDQISRKRWNTRSTRPPKKPCVAPAVTPMIEEKMVSSSPNSTEMRKP